MPRPLTRQPLPRHQLLLLRVALSLGTLGLGLAALEGVARQFAPFALSHGQLQLTMPGEEGGVDTHEERDGVQLWHRQHPGRRPVVAEKHAFRIVVLGDSILQPAGVPDHKGAAVLLEEHLNARDNVPPVEVMNLAEGGYATLQEENVLRHDVPALQPDVVLVGLSPNDDQEFLLHQGRLVSARLLAGADAQRHGVWAPLFAHSYLVNWLWLAVMNVSIDLQDVPVDIARLIDAPLERMRLQVEAMHARMAIVCFPELTHPLDPQRDQCRYPGVEPWAKAHGVAFFNPVPAYAQVPLERIKLDHIHLNPAGHALLAEVLAKWLVDAQLVPTR